MYRMMGQALRLGLLVALVALAVSTCGGEEEPQQSKPRPLPEERRVLRPGEYRSEEFEPSLSFRVGKGWSNAPPEASDALFLTRGGMRALGFVNAREVYKPTRTGIPNVVNAPKDLLGWFRQHPYLRTDKPKHVTVGGIEGVQFDVDAEDLPEDYYSGPCGPGCVSIFRLSTGLHASLPARNKLRLIILEDVKGETATLGFGSSDAQFDEFAPKAQKVVDSVKWRGS